LPPADADAASGCTTRASTNSVSNALSKSLLSVTQTITVCTNGSTVTSNSCRATTTIYYDSWDFDGWTNFCTRSGGNGSSSVTFTTKARFSNSILFQSTSFCVRQRATGGLSYTPNTC
jgi:hypothetical protein